MTFKRLKPQTLNRSLYIQLNLTWKCYAHRGPVQVQQPVRDPGQLLGVPRLHDILRDVSDERLQRLGVTASCMNHHL